MCFPIFIMTEKLIYFLQNIIEMLETSVYMGPDGTAYEIFICFCCFMFQLMAFGDNKLVDKLRGQHPFFTTFVVLIWGPGMLARIIYDTIIDFLDLVVWLVKRRRLVKRRLKQWFLERNGR